VKAITLQIEDHIIEAKQLHDKISKLKESFHGHYKPAEHPTFANSKSVRVKGVVEAVQETGELLKILDDVIARMGYDKEGEANDPLTFPNHLKEVAPIFEIDSQREVEIMANKYRLQTE